MINFLLGSKNQTSVAPKPSGALTLPTQSGSAPSSPVASVGPVPAGNSLDELQNGFTQLALPGQDFSTSMTDPTSPSTGRTASQVAAAAANAAVNVATGGLVGTAPGESSSGSIMGFGVSSLVTIVVGLLFIAAGIFSFKGARETVISAAKTAAVA